MSILTQGISLTSHVFQRKLNQAVDGLSEIRTEDDNLLVWDRDSQEEGIWDHDAKLLQLLNRCRKQNIKLNLEKLKLGTKVPYMGHLLILTGL